jgi:aspartyl-tRNA synthetase
LIKNKKGYIYVIRLTDIQDKKNIFYFNPDLLAEIEKQMLEKSGSKQSELVIFIDKTHLIFNKASKTLLQQIKAVVKLIRSKGIKIYFIPHNPMHVFSSVLR